jgi:hypothetical protein
LTKRRPTALHQAFDELRFGSGRTLNLRDSLPSGAEAVRRADSWLREKQVEGAGEVLVITGRGNQSLGQIPIVREEVRKLLGRLRRRGVVESVAEHTPGSFAVRLASVAALFDAPRRAGDKTADPTPAPAAALAGLEGETRRQLRELAVTALESLGARVASDGLIEEEMLRQFAALSRPLPATPNRDRLLRDAIMRAREHYDERGR